VSITVHFKTYFFLTRRCVPFASNSYSLFFSCCSVVARLEGNPLCIDSLLSDTTPCTNTLTELPTTRPSTNIQCANPFLETIVFRSPSFGDVKKYLPELHSNLSSTLGNCTSNHLGDLVPYTDDVYLKVEIMACPVNQKRFNYSQVLNCFNLTL
jgi:hypothetical protein